MLDKDHQLGRRALAWTHGYGRKDRATGVTEVDFLIDLAAAEGTEPSSYGRTAEAEATLGWSPSIYWYVGVVDDAFGEVAVGEWNPPLSVSVEEQSDGSIAPFDTGAFAVDPPKVSVAPKDQIDYVRRHVFGLGAWHAMVVDGLSTSYENFDSYVMRQSPAPPSTEDDHSYLTSDPRAWTWEARISKRTAPNLIGAPDALYWSSEDRRRIVEARLEDRLDVAETPGLYAAAEVIASRSVVSGDGTHRRLLESELVSRGSI